MDDCQQTVPGIPVSFRKCHLHRVGVETQAERPGLIQKTPNNPAPPLASHEPLDVRLLRVLVQLVARIGFCLGALLAADVGRVVTAHGSNLCGRRGGTRTLSRVA